MENSLASLNIGWIGTGVMGYPMCEKLLNAGYRLHLYNRTESKAKGLIEMGAIFTTPEKMAKECDIIFLMLGYPKDVHNMVLNETALAKSMKSGSIIIDHTTSSPALSQELFAKCKDMNIHFLDAPVSGTHIVAKTGKLAIMVGGEKSIYEKVYDLFKCYGANIRYMGEAGKGQHTKMVAQICLAINLQGVTEAFLYAHKAGLKLEDVFSCLEHSGASSYVWSIYGKKFLHRDFEPGVFIEYFIKDLELVLEEARRTNLSLPCLGFVKQFYQAVMAQGGPKIAFQGILLVLENLNNTKIPAISSENQQYGLVIE